MLIDKHIFFMYYNKQNDVRFIFGGMIMENVKKSILDMFPTGYYTFHDDVRLNANLNLLYSMGIFSLDELMGTGRRIDGFEKWITVFSQLGEDCEKSGEDLKAAFCWYSAMFYTSSTVQTGDGAISKRDLYEKSRAMFDRYYAAVDELKYERVPFENYYIPVYYSTREDAKGTILLCGGYDSIIQEFLGLSKYFREMGYNIYFYEGPGQGEVLMRCGVHMDPEWERCTGAVLDHFGLDDVTSIGISLGGYLAPRAAAYDKRISRVIMCDLIYDFYGAIIGKMGDKGKFFDRLVSHPKDPMWGLVNRKLEKNYFAKWLLDQGYSLFENVHTPCEYFNYIKKFNTREISPMITQDVLVLAGASDLYTIFYDDQIKALTNAKTVTGRIFTAKESADHHCQIGNIPLLLRTMTDWLAERESAG